MTNRKMFSRRDARPSFAVQPHDPEKWLPVFGQDHAQETVNDSAEHHRVTPETGGGTGFLARSCFASVARVEQRETRDGHFQLFDRPRVSLRSTRATRAIKSGSRTPPGACLPMVRAMRARLALIAARSPDGVPPRYLRPRTNAAAQLQNALPGTRLPAGVIRRLLSQSSDKVADRSSCRSGVFPLAARERR